MNTRHPLGAGVGSAPAGSGRPGPIKNLELVRELLALYRAHPACRLKWTAAHAGNRWNEYADSLATAWMRSTL